MIRRLILLITILCSPASFAAEPADTPPSGTASTSAGGQAELYLFNDSGWTLIPGDQVVADNGIEIARLPRQTYVKLPLKPGLHSLKPEPPLWKQEVQFTAEAGQQYFVVVAYKPERSWLMPLAGTLLVLRQISEEQAAQLQRELKAK